MTELEVQISLYWQLQLNHIIVVPNIFIFEWESDLIAIPRSGLIVEYEIKLSKGDLKVDFKKLKHRLLCGGAEQWDVDGGLSVQNIIRKTLRIPARFYFVFPEGMIAYSDIPRYAGIVTVSTSGFIDYIRQAPLISHNKITEAQYINIAKSLSHRHMQLLSKWKKYRDI